MSGTPFNLMKKGKSAQSKMECEGCNKFWRVRHVVKIKGKFLCSHCKNKRLTSRLQRSASTIKSGALRMSLKDALAKTYIINGYIGLDGNIKAQKAFPSILIGHKIKLVLVKKDKEVKDGGNKNII